MPLYQLNLCGLEKAYMQKLSLYFKKRMGRLGETGIWDVPPEQETQKEMQDDMIRIWAGSAECIRRLKSQEKEGYGAAQAKEPKHILYQELCETTAQEASGAICAYQSADLILDTILLRADALCRRKQPVRTAQLTVTSVFDLCEQRALFTCGLGYAQTSGTKRRILVLDLVPCSGMERLLATGPAEKDLADLILALRRGNADGLPAYLMHCGNFDLIPAAGNPAAIMELTAEDMDLLFACIAAAALHEEVVVLTGTPFPGIPLLLQRSTMVFCLQDDGEYSGSRAADLKAYYLHCGGTGEAWQDICLGSGTVRCTGMHLLYEWMHDERTARMWQALL